MATAGAVKYSVETSPFAKLNDMLVQPAADHTAPFQPSPQESSILREQAAPGGRLLPQDGGLLGRRLERCRVVCSRLDEHVVQFGEWRRLHRVLHCTGGRH